MSMAAFGGRLAHGMILQIEVAAHNRVVSITERRQIDRHRRLRALQVSR
jgi:hypothetical protein